MVAKVLSMSPASGYELRYEAGFPVLQVGGHMVVQAFARRVVSLPGGVNEQIGKWIYAARQGVSDGAYRR